jgi:putative sterol carrier protein
MDLAGLTEKVQGALGPGSGFDKKVKFDFGPVGKLLIDGVANKVSNEDGAADATVSVNFDDFLKLAEGQLDPMMAYMSGKLKVAGDMGVAMKLQTLFTKLKA